MVSVLILDIVVLESRQWLQHAVLHFKVTVASSQRTQYPYQKMGMERPLNCSLFVECFSSDLAL